MGPKTIQKKFASCLLETSRRAEPAAEIMSTLNYAWNVRGTLNGDFISASGTTASVDGVADVHGTAGEGSPFNHSSWIWGGMAHYGLGYMKGGHKVNPCEKYPFHMTRHWYGEDGAHIWSSHTIDGAEGAWAGDIACVAEYFQPKGPICQGKIVGGATYTAHVHEYMKFWEPCVTINRHFWKVDYLAAEYYPDHWYHKEMAVVDPNWNYGPSKEKM